ncbi:hypothetical protein D5R40_29295 [Okeania hirsuta]|uniref:Uncharacterized protein n=1 Tax=Okeania hirsuta TaxID=1458930 RepID=A0A3N6NYS5_9CYAN|nr:hypothetical protein D5R40_29295 [Okeania hirsuta]
MTETMDIPLAPNRFYRRNYIFNFSDAPSGYQVNQGDEILVKGQVEQFRGLVEVFVDDIVLISSEMTYRDPLEVSMLDESTESEYITLGCVAHC